MFVEKCLLSTFSLVYISFLPPLFNGWWMNETKASLPVSLCFLCLILTRLVFAPSNLQVTTTSQANSLSLWLLINFLLLIFTENNWSPPASPLIIPLPPVSSIYFLWPHSRSVPFPFPSTAPFNQRPHHLLSSSLVRSVTWQRNANWTMVAISTHNEMPLKIKAHDSMVTNLEINNPHHLFKKMPMSSIHS